MTLHSLFATPLYAGAADDTALIKALTQSCRAIARQDRAGQRWCQENGYPGYTSYASLNDLVLRDPDVAALKPILDRHVKLFAKACNFRLARALRLDSLWVNILKPGGFHSGHIHPGSVVSGTIYIAVPPGAGALRLEDPRLPLMMAAPQRTPDAQPFHYVQPKKGDILLWESWLRHEVVAGTAKSDRISISFNYR